MSLRHTAKCKVKKRSIVRSGGVRYNTKGLPVGTNARRFGIKELKQAKQIAALHAARIKI